MKRMYNPLLGISVLLIFSTCDNFKSDSAHSKIVDTPTADTIINLLTDIDPLNEDGDVNAVIEIPAGTLEKWELNKSTGQVELEFVDGKPRIIKYLGYPGNYGMIPRTLLSTEQGGDGDPLDVIVLGPPIMRGSIVKCKIIGVLYLLDAGEQDDKLIAISADSPLYDAEDMRDLKTKYKGVSDIMALWFTNYKGGDIMDAKGYGDKADAINILNAAMGEYESAMTGYAGR